ncbi:MAG: thioredoxin family protein [Candidatus Hodarchaeales archaeon]|jgi:small redox-active disulfide protein 2
MTRIIEILGGGCSKCEALTKSAESVVEKLGWQATIVHITDMDEIVERGIFTTPALALDGEIIVSGRYLPPNQLETLFLKYPAKK